MADVNESSGSEFLFVLAARALQVHAPGYSIRGGHEHAPWEISVGPDESDLLLQLHCFTESGRTHLISGVRLVQADAASFRVRLLAENSGGLADLRGTRESSTLTLEPVADTNDNAASAVFRILGDPVMEEGGILWPSYRAHINSPHDVEPATDAERGVHVALPLTIAFERT